MFSKNTKNGAKARMLNAFGINGETRNERYLGLPVYVGRSKTKIFGYLKDRMWSKVQGWIEKWLTKMGKEILVKACAQAIPIFAMSCFDISKTLCDQMGQLMCKLWWSQQENENKLHWLSWDKLTLP
jgi:hypothetical protein